MKLLNKVKITLLIAIFMGLFISSKSFAVTGTITEITVNLRKEPSTDSKKIMYVTQDDKVEVLEKNGDWYKIKFNGTTGYVFGKYVKVDDSKLETVETESQTTTTENETTEDTTTKTETTDTKTEETKTEVEDVNTNLIINKKTNIRIIPNISSSVIYTAKKDIEISIIKQLKDWSYISVDNISGWVRTDKIVEQNQVLPDDKKEETKKEESKTETVKKEETVEQTKQEEKTAYIKYDTVNLRKKASTSSTVLAKLKLNEEVTVLEKVDSKWSKVKVDGVTGYVSTELLADEKQEVKKVEETENETTSRDSESTKREETTVKEEKETSKTETVQKETTTSETKKEESVAKVTGEDIVAYAKKYLGYDYAYGGTLPKSGFDCSGFTSYVYKHFGYTLSRSSKAQAKNGKEVSKSELKPGDLLIFKNQSLTAIGHVGIYVGDNKMIHSSEPGVGVVITDLDANGYNYNKRYVTARRII